MVLRGERQRRQMMARLTVKEREIVQRALGIIEGVACCVPADATSMLITALEMIDSVVDGGAERE